MIYDAVVSDTMELVWAAIATGAFTLAGIWVQNRKTRRMNSGEHGVSMEILTEIRDEQRDMRSDIRETKADVRLIKQEATVVRNRLDALERRPV